MINKFIKAKSEQIYLPRCSFSFNMVQPAKVTIRSIKGVKTEANNEPLICTHHEITATIASETTIPCTMYMIKFDSLFFNVRYTLKTTYMVFVNLFQLIKTMYIYRGFGVRITNFQFIYLKM